jgi:hypothetical protein
MSAHFNTGPGYPQTRKAVRELSRAGLQEFMGECDVEPADFDNCLACYAYEIFQNSSEVKDIMNNSDRMRVLLSTTSDTGEWRKLRCHIRESHPSLLGEGWDTSIAFSPLPNDGLSEVPNKVLLAIHEASHMGCWREHLPDDWSTYPKESP